MDKLEYLKNEIDSLPPSMLVAVEGFHAYPDVAHTAISPRVHVQDGPMYPCIGARKSVALSGRRFSAHYRRPLMARIAGLGSNFARLDGGTIKKEVQIEKVRDILSSIW